MSIKLGVEVRMRVIAVGAGTGVSGLGGLNADDPTYGQSGYPSAARIAESKYFSDWEPVTGTYGAVTLANINNALAAAVAALAGSSGTPKISTEQLAEINGWFSGSP